MNKPTNEIFNDKVSLIYEYNKRSPLFVRMANTEIENNNVDKAILILQNGLRIYPDYSAAYLLLGKANTLIGNYSLALKNFKTGSDLANSKKTYDYYLKELENIKKQRSLFDGNTKNAFLFEDEKPDKLHEPEIARPAAKSYETASVEERLAELAKRISTAKIPEVTDTTSDTEYELNNFSEGNLIVSETLAKIYTTQGEYNEAIEVYKKLIRKNPQKIDYYTQKINALNSELES